jgi:RHS repeat-associated protein
MLRRAWIVVASLISLFILNQSVNATEINAANYDIYIGDVNGDGKKDFYFKGKLAIIILHGDIATPITVVLNYDFVVYQSGSSYSAPALYSIPQATLAANIANGSFKLAQAGVDYVSWKNAGTDQSNILLRGADKYAPAVMFTSFNTVVLPITAQTYSLAVYTGISDPNVRLTLQDINNDGRQDIVLEDLGSAAWKTGYISDELGTPLTKRELRPSTVSPLSGATIAVGTTTGQFRVDESGAATYSVPIYTPDGVAGVKPQLTLNYSSNAGKGIAGQGWSLTGMASIARCRQTVSQDSKARPITWSAEDRFCFNGQRLMVVTGIYGAPDSTYRTEIDSFEIITAKGGVLGHPAYFTVGAKDGSTSYLGNTPDSKLVASSANASTTTLTWSVNRFSDNVGNSIDFAYEGDATTGNRIKTIHYAFPSTTAGLAAARTDSNARISFIYDDRSDIFSSYVAGYLFTQTKRLAKITVINQGAEVRNYTLAYMPEASSDNRYKNKTSRLEAIQECKNTTCLAPLMFKWGGGSHVALNQSTQAVSIDSPSGQYFISNSFADVNGDGKQDLIYIMYKSPYATGQYPNRALVGVSVKYAGATQEVSVFNGVVNDYTRVRAESLDYNADGRADIAVYDGSIWRIFISTLSAGGAWTTFTQTSDAQLTDADTVFTDYNGDGLVDAITSYGYALLAPDSSKSITSSQYYKFATKTDFGFNADDFPEVKQNISDTDLSPSCKLIKYSISVTPSSMGDFNGDGIPEFTGSFTERVSNTCSYMWEGTNGSNEKVSTKTYTFISRDNKLIKFGPTGGLGNVRMMDINGDGLSDRVSNSGNLYHFDLSTGTGFTTAWGTAINLSGSTTNPPVAQFLDVNGDGALDIIWFDSTANSIMVRLWGDTVNSVLRANTYNATDGHFVMDVSGDGVLDYTHISATKITTYQGIMAVSGAAIPCHYETIPVPDPSGGTYQACVGGIANPTYPVPANEQYNGIFAIDNGMGNLTNIFYGTLANSGHYATLEVNSTTVTTTPDCSAYTDHNSEAYGRCMSAGTSVTTADGFYANLNGGWNLPAGSLILQANKTLTTANATKASPVIEVNGNMRIVTAVGSSAPLPSDATATSKVEYFYGEAKMQAAGRGFLGFARIKTFDVQSGVNTVTNYRQDFPFSGTPLSTYVSAPFVSLSQSTNTWSVKIGAAPGIYQLYMANSLEKSFSLNVPLMQTTATATTMDTEGFGNPTSIIITTTDASTGKSWVKTTTNNYGTDLWEKQMGRLRSTIVSTVQDGVLDNDRSVTFDYYGTSDGTLRGLLKSETVDTSGIKTVYTYDAFGNKKTVATTGLNALGVSETRTITNSYDGTGRYLISSLNDLGQSASVTARNEYGQATSSSDINGVNTKIFYDDLGNEYMRKDDTGAWSRTESAYCVGSVTCPTNAKFRVYKRVAGGGSTITYHDILGRVIRSSTVSFDGTNALVDTEYDNLSRVNRQSTPYFGALPTGWTSSSFDTVGRIKKTIAPDGSYTTYMYSSKTTEIKIFDVSDYLLQSRLETHNGWGQTIQVKDNIGGLVDYAYTVTGALKTATTTAAGASPVSVRMCYDSLGRKIGMLDPDKGGFKSTVTSCTNFNASAPPVGWWSYQYDAFGELVKQTDPKGQTTSMTYDIVGRMLTRTDKFANGTIDGYTRWYYDKQINGSAQTGAKGQVTAIINNADGSQVCTSASHCTYYIYDSLTRPIQTQVKYPNSSANFITSVQYDEFGRAYEQHDPLQGIVLGTSGTQTLFNQYGYAYKKIDLSDGQLLQETLTTNARGQVLTERRGNGAVTTNTYYGATGLLRNQTAAVSNLGAAIQNNTYVWDALGNLTSRQNQSAAVGGTSSKNLSESFSYDGLNRLIKTTTVGSSVTPTCNNNTQDISYNGYGNITCKNVVGTFTYAAGTVAGPHAVTSTAADGTYSYDNNGNQIGGAGRTLIYTSYDMVSSITKDASNNVTFKYGPDRARWQRIDKKAGVADTTTTYIGNIERIEFGTTIEWKRYVGGVVYTYKTNSSNVLSSTDKRYLYNDHLGSLDVITDALGRVSHSESFDSWGARRAGDDWKTFDPSTLKITNFTRDITTRGFTGHEMVDDMGIIHMNGRIYDPRLARFLQADPFIQAAGNTQSYNRYSYVLNNPLNKIDPSGFLFLDAFDPSRKSRQSSLRAISKVVGPQIVNLVGSAILTYWFGSVGAAAWAYDFGTAMGASKGDAYRSAGIAFASASISSYVGGLNLSIPQQILVNAMVGGVMAELQGGEFGHGFVSAGISTGISATGIGGAFGSGTESTATGLLVNAIIGGTVSEITGGKFANGALSGAMNYAIQWGISEIAAGGVTAANKPQSGTEKSCNPINIATGEKYLTMTDYHAEGASQMVFERYYSSYASEKSSLGFGWRSNFDRNLKLDAIGDTTLHIVAIRHQGDPIRFDWVEGESGEGKWITDNHGYETIRKTGKGWELQLTDNSRETYDDAGHLIHIKKIDGYEQTLSYGNQGTVKNVLLAVTDNFGQKLTFSYDLSARMLSMTANDVSTTHYAYDLADNLVKVTSPDNTPNNVWDNPYKVYDYSDKRFAHAITGIRNSEGKRIHSMAYDDQGHAILSALGDDAERVDMAFSQGDNNTKQTIVKNSLGKNTTYTFNQQNKPLLVEGNPTASCIGSNQGYQYNDNGQLISKTDWNGSTTRYEYNDRGLETSRTESVGTAQERRMTTVWHSQWRLPTQIAKADLVVEFTYSEQGQLIKRVERDIKADRTGLQKLFKQYPEREWNYTYNAKGLLAEVDGSRNDVNDITRFEYDANGNRTSVVNALGHRSEVLAVNERGLPLQVRDANGVVTELAYNARGWLVSKTLKSEQGESTTSYDYSGESDYNDVGLISAITLPNGQQVHYAYDSARRLIAQSNNAGESIKYTLDLEGNRLNQAIYGSGGELMTTQRQVFDELSRVLQSIGADDSITHFAYDKTGNRISTTDAVGNKTAYAYDALNRLMATTDAANGVVAQAYDQADRVTSVTDQRGLITQYRYNGFGNRIAQISPDTGETRFGYDEAGNLVSKKDARGVVTQYHYDAIGRVLNVLYPAANDDNIHYSYDNQKDGNKGIGRLANVTDASGEQSYNYNAMGQVTEQLYKIGNTAYSVGYNYDRNGQLNSLRYPNGRTVSYGYDSEGHVATVTTSSNGVEQSLVQQVSYLPFGPMASFTYGNGANLQLEHDQNYRLRAMRVTPSAVNDAVYDRHYDYDATSNIISITDRKAKERSQQFNYDALYRLTAATGSYGQTSYHYDAVGNRTAREQSGKLEAYSYANNSNRLLNVISEGEQGQLQTRNLDYDAVGNITRDMIDGAGKQLSYGANNRLQQVDVANQQLAGYEHNAKGQRVIKRVNGKVIHFHYNVADQLIAETDASGQPIREYLYGAGQRLAMVDYTSNKAGGITYMVNDHLGTPQLLLNAKQQVVWSVDQSPFGEVKTEGNVEQPLRFPGQYADVETGYSYNYFRDYDPSLGRYIESDPIGLEGGVNTFGYVGGRVVMIVDPYGLLNPTKAAAATFNQLNAYRKAGQGVLMTRVAVFSAVIGQPEIALPAAGLAVYNLKGAESAALRGAILWTEAAAEPMEAANLKNMLGILPFGEYFDDPSDPYPWEINKVKELDMFSGKSAAEICSNLASFL